MVRVHIEKIPARRVDSHKGDYGKVFVLAGSIGMTGAAYLCCQGALRAGSGLVVNGIQKSLNAIMEVKLTEAMTLPLPEDKDGILGRKAEKTVLNFVKTCDVVAMGPGLGRHAKTRSLIKDLIRKIEKPLVLDADGLNALDGNLDLIKKRKGNTILTPHPGEAARLLKKDVQFVQLQRVDVAKRIAKETGAVVCLKGHKTVIADPGGQVYVNETGNSGMASGGTGDVLTGMIASFAGQGVEDMSAAVCGAYLHGLAGDIAAEKKGAFSLIATDIIECIPYAFIKAGV